MFYPEIAQNQDVGEKARGITSQPTGSRTMRGQTILQSSCSYSFWEMYMKLQEAIPQTSIKELA